MINKLSSSEVNKHTSHSVFDKLNELVDKVNELEIRLKGFEKK